MSLNIVPLYLGTFSVGTDKKFIRIEPDQDAARGALKISQNPFLIRYGERNMLIDTGIGDFAEESVVPILHNELEQHNCHTDQITDVFLSHLHFDHMGALAHRSNGFWDMTFPNARIWLSEQEWKKLNSLTQEDPLKEQYLHYLDTHADFHFVNNLDKPFDGVTVKVIGGHTEFSLAWFFDFDNTRMLNAGDVIGTKGHVLRRFTAKYDFDGKKSQQNRDELIAMAYDEKYLILAFHDNESPIFRVSQNGDEKSYSIIPYTPDS